MTPDRQNLLVITYVQEHEGKKVFWEVEKWFDLYDDYDYGTDCIVHGELLWSDIFKFMEELDIYDKEINYNNFSESIQLNEDFEVADEDEQTFETKIYSIEIFNEEGDLIDTMY